MFAVYAIGGNFEKPLTQLRTGSMPEPTVKEGWQKVKVTHASLNRHDIFTLQGLSGQEEPIPYPMIMGNDGAGTLPDGTPVAIYPVMNAAGWMGDEMLDPKWNVFSELVPGTFADYVAVPNRNAVPLPKGMAPEKGAVLGTAWLLAYRGLFRKSGLLSGQRMLIQGAAGGVATALIQLGKAAGFEIWTTVRDDKGAKTAERLGAHRIFKAGEKLPVKADAVFDSVGTKTIPHSLESVKRGGTVVTMGMTTGSEVSIQLLPIFVQEITLAGAVMGTREEFIQLLNFVHNSGIKPETGKIVPLEEAEAAFAEMWEGKNLGKTLFTR